MPNQKDDNGQQKTQDYIRELDQRQHEVARRLHVLEFQTSEAVQEVKNRLRDQKRRKDDIK